MFVMNSWVRNSYKRIRLNKLNKGDQILSLDRNQAVVESIVKRVTRTEARHSGMLFRMSGNREASLTPDQVLYYRLTNHQGPFVHLVNCAGTGWAFMVTPSIPEQFHKQPLVFGSCFQGYDWLDFHILRRCETIQEAHALAMAWSLEYQYAHLDPILLDKWRLQKGVVHQLVSQAPANRDGLLPKHPLFRSQADFVLMQAGAGATQHAHALLVSRGGQSGTHVIALVPDSTTVQDVSEFQACPGKLLMVRRRFSSFVQARAFLQQQLNGLQGYKTRVELDSELFLLACARQVPVFSSTLGVNNGKLQEIKINSKENLININTSFAELELESRTEHDAIIQDLVIPGADLWDNWNDKHAGVYL